MGIFDRFKKDEPKPKADFSNVQSGSASTAPAPLPQASAPAADAAPAGTSEQMQTHVVASGESLSKIAKRYYGDANKWQRIFDANRDQITNPDLIHPGQQLKIPNA
jgi:nucleoid-associated protein YgaU